MQVYLLSLSAAAERSHMQRHHDIMKTTSGDTPGGNCTLQLPPIL